ncbi:MAG: iron dependent repressor, metal binding and dimerization domain protein, partial [Halarsenatibacteraceae bacterium]
DICCRHQMIKEFLTNVLGVEDEVAENDACMMEHVVSNVTMKHLVEYLAEENEILASPDCSSKFN